MRLDSYIAQIHDRIGRLPPWKAALFYASCAERFFSLYVAFSDAEQWGAPDEVRRHLDSAWASAVGGKPDQVFLESALANLLQNTPHSDDFESVETTFAQDVCVLISASLRSAAEMPDDNAIPIDAVFEILRVAKCVEATGYLDLGDSPRAVDLELQFINSPLFQGELDFQEQDLALLSATKQPSDGLISNLRSRAEGNSYSIREILPTKAACLG